MLRIVKQQYISFSTRVIILCWDYKFPTVHGWCTRSAFSFPTPLHPHFYRHHRHRREMVRCIGSRVLAPCLSTCRSGDCCVRPANRLTYSAVYEQSPSHPWTISKLSSLRGTVIACRVSKSNLRNGWTGESLFTTSSQRTLSTPASNGFEQCSPYKPVQKFSGKFVLFCLPTSTLDQNNNQSLRREIGRFLHSMNRHERRD